MSEQNNNINDEGDLRKYRVYVSHGPEDNITDSPEDWGAPLVHAGVYTMYLRFGKTSESAKAERKAQGHAKLWPKPGYVYLVQGPPGLYKIGKSKDPEDRVRTFGVKLPFEVDLIHTIQCADYTAAEKALHLRFADKRSEGEWFALADEDVETIKAISAL